MNNYSHIESTLIHGGVFGDALTHSVNVPIYQTSTYQQFELEGNPKWEYSRTGNPTRAALEALCSELGLSGAVCFAGWIDPEEIRLIEEKYEKQIQEAGEGMRQALEFRRDQEIDEAILRQRQTLMENTDFTAMMKAANEEALRHLKDGQ